TFEEHLTHGVGYQGPQLLRAAVVGEAEAQSLDVLDLRCGTGLTRAIDRRAAGVRSGASSRFFSAAAITHSSSRRRTKAWSCRTCGDGGTHARGVRSRANPAIERASAGSVLLACPHAFMYAFTRAGLATLTT